MLKILLFVVSFFVFQPDGTAQRVRENEVSVRYEKAVERASQFMRDSIRVSGIPGASISVSVHGVPVWSRGFGYADLEQKVPVTPETKFRVGTLQINDSGRTRPLIRRRQNQS